MFSGTPSRPHIFITAGDPSGDAHAARLMAEIRRRVPDVVFEGFGGPAMELEGLRSLARMRDLAVTGFWEVAKRYGYFRDLMARCADAIKRTRPVAFIPVDYPGFNMRLAARVRSPRLPVIWYIAPQLWAWGEGRAEGLSKVVDRLLVVFPFEVEFFARHGIRADYVGHPLVDRIREEPVLERNLSQVLLMPGSRRQEIHHHVPILAETVERVSLDDPSVRFGVARARNVDVESLAPLMERGVAVVDDVPLAMATAGAGLVKAGTSTLEAALRGLPFATFYRTSAISYAVSKRLVNVSSVTMLNLLLQRNVVHEYLQTGATAANLADEIRDLRTNAERRAELAAATDEVRSLLAGEGAAARAAHVVVEAMRS